LPLHPYAANIAHSPASNKLEFLKMTLNLMRRAGHAVVLVSAFLFLSAPCYAWNSTGHEIVAQIAYDNLTPDTKAKMIAILKLHPRLKQDLLADAATGEDTDRAMFIRAATWPDMVRYPINPMSRTENHGPWHYVDYPYVLDDTKAPAVDETWDGKSVPANLLQAMDKAITELKDPATTPDRKAIDLCWVEHLVGDIHQPLHAVSMFSKEFPTGDRGGNSLMVKSSNGNINLHAFWDDAAGLSLDPDVIRKTADRFEKDHPADSLKDQVADLKVTDWAQESLALAKEKVYLNGTIPHATSQAGQNDPNSVPALPDGYEKNAAQVADLRIALAGYRLAAVLEEIAKSQPAAN
jgi:hypothetical protein